MNYDIGTAIIQGVEGAIDRKRKLQLQAKQLEQQNEVFDLNKNKLQLQVQQLQNQLKQQQAKQVKEGIYSAWDNQNIVDLNKPEYTKVLGVKNIDFFPLNPTPAQLEAKKKLEEQAKRYGIKAEPYIGIDPKTATPVVFDMNLKKLNSGYLAYKKQKQLMEEAQQLRLQKIMASLAPKPKSLDEQYVELSSKSNRTPEEEARLKSIERLKGIGVTKNDKVTNAGLKQEYVSLKVKAAEGKLTPDEKVKLDTYNQLFTTDNEQKRNILTKGISLVDKYYKGGLFNQKIAKDDVVNAKLYEQQTGYKVDDKSAKELKDNFVVVSAANKLNKKLSELKPEELNRGLEDTGLQKLRSYLGDGKLTEKDIKSIKFQSQLGKFVAEYLRSISGTAVAKDEFARINNILGGDNLKSIDAAKAAFGGFYSSLVNNFKTKLQANLLSAPSTTLDLARRFQELGVKVASPSPQSQEPLPGVSAPSDVVIDPKTGKPTQYKVGQIVEMNGKKYKILDTKGTVEEITQ